MAQFTAPAPSTALTAAPPACPLCAGAWQTERLRCTGCGCALEGRFAPAPLSGLDPAQKQLAEEFLLCGGNLKDLGERLQLSYPTVRARLDEVIAALRQARAPQPKNAGSGQPGKHEAAASVERSGGGRSALARKERIVELMESGAISPAAGKELLREVI